MNKRIVLITGGTSGIGLAIAQAFADQGDAVCLVARRKRDTFLPILEKSGGEFYEADVADFKRAHEVLDKIKERFGRLDVLVNCAGVTKDGILWKMSEEDWDRIIDTNLKGAFNYSRASAPLFRAQKSGKVINVSSTVAIRARVGLANYIASKTGIMGLTKAVARDLGSSNVNVNAVAPGLILTEIVTEMPEEVKERVKAETALGRIGTPEDVASVVLFLASEASRHITGEIIRVDGGMLA